MTKWISVKDRLPESGIFVLVGYYEDKFKVGINVYSKRNGWELKLTDAYNFGITHWMPLPEMPENE